MGLLPLLDMAEAGRRGGPMVLSAVKKLDLRRVLLAARDEGSCDRLSTVLSDSEGRDFFLGVGCARGERSTATESDSTADSLVGSCSSSCSLSRKPALDSARDDAREADRKPSSLPSVSSSCGVRSERADETGGLDWRDGGRAKGRRNAGVLLVGAAAVVVLVMGRSRMMLGMPLTRREAATGALLAGGLAIEARDAFLCSVAVAVAVAPMVEREGFLRSWSDEAGARSCEWLTEERRTGRREVAGRGMAEGIPETGRGSEEARGSVMAGVGGGGWRWQW